MANKKQKRETYHTGILLHHEHIQAIDALGKLKNPSRGNMRSQVVRDLITWGFWGYMQHLHGVPIPSPKPLPYTSTSPTIRPLNTAMQEKNVESEKKND